MTIDVVDGGQDAGTSGASTQGNRAVSFAPTMTIDVDGGLDQTAPVLSTGADAPKVSGDKLVLRYSEANLLGTAHPDPAAHAFAVTVNGRTNPVTDVAVDSQTKTVTLTLTRPVTGGEDVSVTYTKPTDSSKAIQDAAGNIADDITAPLRVNSGTDTTAPTLVADTVAPPRIGGGGKELVLTYEDANYLKAVQVPKTAFAVLVNGTPNDVTAVKVDGGQDKTVTLMLSRSVPSGAEVSIAYTPPGESTQAIQDRQGNPAAGIVEPMHVDSGRDQTAPMLVFGGISTVSGDKLVLGYSEANLLGTAHPDPAEAARAFAVTVNGRTNPVTGVAVDSQDKTVTLTLTRPVTGGEDVRVAYTKPADSSKAIQDAAGNFAKDITAPFPVDSGRDTTAPTLVTDTVAPPRIGGGKELVLTYEEANYLKAVQVPKTAFAVLVNGTPNDVTAVKVDDGQDKTVTLTLSRSVPSGADVSIAYTPPGESTEAIQDWQGNPAAGIREPMHVDSGRDQTAPVLVFGGISTVSGDKLVLSYDEDNNLDTVHKALAGSFTVLVDGSPNPVTEVSVANAPAKTVTLTLTKAVARGVPVTVAYQATADNAIQDMAGNRALDITEPMIHVDNGEAPTDPAQTAGTSGTGTPGTTAHDAGTSGVITTGATPPDASTSGTGTPGTTAPDAGTPGVVTTGVTLHDSGTPGTGTPGTGTSGTGTLGTGTSGTGTSGTGTLGTGTSGTGTSGTGTPGTGTPGTGTPGTGTPGTGTPGTSTPGTGTSGTTAPDTGTPGVITTDTTTHDAGTPGTGTGTPGTTAPDASVPGVITTGATAPDAGTPGASASGATPHDTGTPGAGTTTPGTGTPGTTAPDASAPSPSENNATPSPPSDSTPSSGSPSTADVLDIVSQFSMVGNQANDQTPATPVAPVAGDRNADGVLDRTQPAVHSISVTPNANAPGSLADAPSGLVTLVNDSQDGKVRPGSQERITSLEQKDAPAQLPKGMEMPIGLLHAQVTQAVDSGHPASLSLFVALALNVNELWVQDNGTGVWTNLASAPYGGKTVLADGQLRLDIHIDDGGPFDADGKVDGVVSVVGAAAHMPLSIVGQAPDVAQHGFWF
ncbi:SwmB domain-containing protein [Verminephrobacter eiseniae]|uniref:Outer membrane protein n=3 Tax=Verminephrobacter eiseniae TaxID=364317 RepID=A1WR79_VEREI|nr:outer membrane protein [Verminephrobacter eiseniae EF01-2]